ncbi:cuticle protein 19-like [Nilaparvata lugens]|uniref:Cuticular protein n=1 Tax=Nilaparvata lugens TaxID=108931 RepID=A0A2S1ZSF1_NILLU|nr:cuticle protein 19-like [Nilaparvata lugens]AWK28381.1 cuticular protein [Nilaparvata lugens]
MIRKTAIMISLAVVLSYLILGIVAEYEGSDEYNFPQSEDEPFYYHVPDYRFDYSVASPHTGDMHNRQERRFGDEVSGYYSLMEPDGTYREVHYKADRKHGFTAVVKKYRNGVLIETS